MKEKRYTGKQVIGAVLLTMLFTVMILLMVLGMALGPEGVAVAEGFALTRMLFVGEADLKQASDEALDSVVTHTGDRWTYYLDPEWNESNKLHTANQTKGIGVRILYREEGLLVTDVVPDSGADRAGIRIGEYLTEVEGQPLYGEKQAENKDLIGGEEGTEVLLTVRDGQGREREIPVERGLWFDPPVRSTMLEEDIAYVRIFNFNSGTNDALQEQVDAMVAQGAEGLIFDVRQNGGGYIKELTAVLDYLLPEGTVFRQTTSWGWTFTEQSEADCIDLPMAVLVDENSFSAAELFAAQLRESVDAYIVGEHTSGKGYFQYPFPLSNGGALALSIGTYTTGSGTSLTGVGLEPDETFSLTEEEDNYLAARWLSPEEDPHLQAAMDRLKEKRG